MDESFVGLKIHKNTLLNVGNVGIGCSSCKDAVISDNIIIDEGDVLRTGIAIPAKPEDSLKSQNITISGNKIALNSDRATGIQLKGEYPVKVLNNEVSIIKTGLDAQCIGLEGVNLNLNISSNQCKTHNDISLVDQTLPETEVVENTPEVPVEEEPVVTEPEPETEVVDNTPEVPVEEPVVTEPEPETEVVDSGDNNETVTSFERPSWANQRPVGSGNFTMDSLMESMQNDYSNESASECRFFARGKCLIR